MAKREFHVGDVCRIRQWDDMEAEFGWNGSSIQCDCEFVKDMKHLCGATFTVRAVRGEGRQIYLSEEGIEYGRDGNPHFFWCISGDMLELYEEPGDDAFAAPSWESVGSFLGV